MVPAWFDLKVLVLQRRDIPGSCLRTKMTRKVLDLVHPLALMYRQLTDPHESSRLIFMSLVMHHTSSLVSLILFVR